LCRSKMVLTLVVVTFCTKVYGHSVEVKHVEGVEVLN
jgi:hypothetical protein